MPGFMQGCTERYAAPRTGRPRRDRSKNRAARAARKRGRR